MGARNGAEGAPLVLVGSAPGSGSTLCADLIDSHPGCICGPELRCFSGETFGKFAVWKQNPARRVPVGSIYRVASRPYLDRLPAFGLSRDAFGKMAVHSRSPEEFAERFRRHFAAFRKRSLHAVWVEKSPENAGCARQFLDSFDHGFYIHVIRDPLQTYYSLRRRGFSRYLCGVIWLFENGLAAPLFAHSRVITVMYEELIDHPFDTICAVGEKIGAVPAAPGEIKERYQKNDYRRQFRYPVKSWRAHGNNGIMPLAGMPVPPAVTAEWRCLVQWGCLARSTIGWWHLEPDPLTVCAGRFGYPLPAEKHPSCARHFFTPAPQDRSLLVRKFLFDTLNRPAALLHAAAYWNPLLVN